jgi:hypothetical protein
MMRLAVEGMGLSGRAYRCVLKLNHKIADWVGSVPRTDAPYCHTEYVVESFCRDAFHSPYVLLIRLKRLSIRF